MAAGGDQLFPASGSAAGRYTATYGGAVARDVSPTPALPRGGNAYGSWAAAGAPPGPASASPSSEEAMLRRAADAEIAAATAAKQDLVTLSRNLEVHGRQILAACATARRAGCHGAASERVHRNVAAFVAELRQRQAQWTQLAATSSSAAADEGSPTAAEDPAKASESYDVLRHSLNSAQQRCAALNEDMLRVADANEELMSTMQAVKTTNRRLVDQIQAQNDDIARLTRLRLSDEERIEEIMQTQRAESEKWKKDLDDRLTALAAQHEATFKERRQELTDQLSRLQDHLRSMAAQVSSLRSEQSSAAAEAKASLTRWRVEYLDRISRTIFERLGQQRRDHDAAVALLEDETHALAAKLAVDRDARKRESMTWLDQEKELTEGNRTHASYSSAEISGLRDKVESSTVAREVQTAQAERDRAERTEHLCDLAVQAKSLKAMLATAKSALSAAESRCAREDAEKWQVEEAWRSENKKMKDSDTSLDRAVSSNEELRRMMESRRIEAQDRCDEDVKKRFEQFQASLSQLSDAVADESATMDTRIHSLVQATAERAAEVEGLQLQVRKRSAERASLQRACAMWKGQEELASQLRGEVEQELQRARDAWSRELKALQEQQEALVGRQVQLESELQKSRAVFEEHNRAAELRASDLQSRAMALGASYQEADDALAATKRSLQEEASSLARAKALSAQHRAAALDARHEVEKQLQRCEREALDAREFLTSEANQEWQKAHRAQKECEDMRHRGQLALRDAQSGPMAQIPALEQAVVDASERRRLDAQQAAYRADADIRELKALEEELAKVQQDLNQAERQLQADTENLRFSRGDGTDALEKLKCDAVAAKDKAADARDHQKRVLEEAEEVRRVTAAERVRQERELAELSRDIDKQEALARQQLLARRQEAAAVAGDGQLRLQSERQRAALEAAAADNRRLRRQVIDARGASFTGAYATGYASERPAAAASAAGAFGGGQLSSDMEVSIQRMQQRTEMLRRELQQDGNYRLVAP
eukprot:TRINITY_DN62842_c0_g1_i1.p1 TRINITY_DN62842_c0_g1~~TRINITY_DN62842_c0_g1_i1.p1  ORF type:complete len:1025 (+),score=296.26 TRINITY_DN62842_c0_g1_i1:59-3076(+)